MSDGRTGRSGDEGNGKGVGVEMRGGKLGGTMNVSGDCGKDVGDIGAGGSTGGNLGGVKELAFPESHCFTS
jgi:hypothetical protein